MSVSSRATSTVFLFAALTVLVAAQFAGAAPVADSAILFIGDGMGQAQVELGALVAPLDQPLAIRQLPFRGAATTREAQGEITDSAAAGTALATGRKTNDGMVGVSPDGAPMESILERCQRLGKSVGVITTDHLTGATPASFVAHVDDRGKHAEIALQMARSNVPVLLGFWKMWFAPNNMGGKRTDGLDLILQMRRTGYDVLFARSQLLSSSQPKLLGMFDDDYGAPAPSLADMTSAALSCLSANPKGFFLVVEAARIDWLAGSPAGVLQELHNLDEAVRSTVQFARKRGRTLVVVTADHETGGLIIEDRAKVATLRNANTTEEQMSWRLNSDRSNAKQVVSECGGINDLSEAELEQVRTAKSATAAIASVLSGRAGLKWSAEDHTATPVGVYAFGPAAEAFKGDMDNTDIPKRIAVILDLGPFPQ